MTSFEHHCCSRTKSWDRGAKKSPHRVFEAQKRPYQIGFLTFTHEHMVNLFIINESDIWSRDLNTRLTLDDCLFGAVKLAKNVDSDKYKYSGYGIGFDARSQFLLNC